MGSPATDWCGAPSGNGGFSFQGCGGCFRCPTSEWDPPSVARKAEEEVFTPPRGGHQVPELQGVQSEARAVPKTVPEDTVRNSG